MTPDNPFLRKDQNQLIKNIQSIWQNSLKKVWEEDGELHKTIGNTTEIYTYNKTSAHANSVVPLDVYQKSAEKLIEKRRNALRVSAAFFEGLVKCSKYNELTSDGLSDDTYSEHYAWAVKVLLSKLYNGNKSKESALLEKFKSANNHQALKKTLVESLDKQLEKFQAASRKVNSDFAYLSSAYGPSQLYLIERDANTLPYVEANTATQAYIESNTDSTLASIYKDIMKFSLNAQGQSVKELYFPVELLTKLPAECFTHDNQIDATKVNEGLRDRLAPSFQTAFENALFEKEKLLRYRLNELSKLQVTEQPFKRLNEIETRTIFKALKQIAGYRYSKYHEDHLSQVYAQFSQYFEELLTGSLNELEFQARMESIISKYEPNGTLWTLIAAYVSAIIDYISDKDKEALPHLFYLHELRHFKLDFKAKFLASLDQLSEDSKVKFVQQYADKLCERFAISHSSESAPSTPEHSYAAESGSRSTSQSEAGESSVEDNDSSSSIPENVSELIAKYRSFTGKGNLTELLEEGVKLESQLVAAFA